MKDNPKISVIMPSLNVKEFINECIESVINQTFEDLEIICVDGGSTDGTFEILEKYSKNDSRIKIIQSDVKSYGHQMNLGIEKSSGEYIGIVETDDFIDLKMYETLYDLTNNSTADIAKVNFNHFYSEDNYKPDQNKKKLPSNEFTVYEFSDFLKGHPSIWAGIYKKSFLEENNIKFMEAPGGGWVDNPFLFQTSLSAEKITYKHDALYNYRELNPTSSTNDLKDLTLPMKRMLNIFDILNEYSCDDENILKEFYVRIFWHIQDVLKKNNYDKYRDEIFKYTHEVVEKMDEAIIKEYFKIDDLKVYYTYLSPIKLLKDKIDIKHYNLLNSENIFLYNYISKLEEKNLKLISKNKKLNKTNQSIINSKSYKLGSKFAKPIRYLKRFK